MKPSKLILICVIALMIGGIALATKEVVKGHCGDSKCTYDVYTKEKTDELLNDIYSKTETNNLISNKLIQIETIEGSFSRESGGDTPISTKNIDYPTGFDKDNTILLAIGTRKTGNTNFPDYAFGNTSDDAVDVLQAGSTRRIVRFKADNIELGFSGAQASDSLEVDYKLVIGKMITVE